jgi:hypothetical protein
MYSDIYFEAYFVSMLYHDRLDCISAESLQFPGEECGQWHDCSLKMKLRPSCWCHLDSIGHG